MKTVLVLNAYGKHNIGDQLINEIAISMIDQSLKKSDRIYVMCENPANYVPPKTKATVIPIYSLYGYIINESGEKPSALRKIIRFLQVYVQSLWYLLVSFFSPRFLPEKGLYAYISIISIADAVIGMGGGYLRTKSKFTDYFGLLLTLLPMKIAQLYHKNILYLPMSFGNFASKIHEEITLSVLSGTKFICRDYISLNTLSIQDKQGKIDKQFLPDLAIYYSSEKLDLKQKFSSDYIVLTARKWLTKSEQERFEKYLADFIDFLWQNYRVKTKFIAMANNIIEDNDFSVSENINQLVKHHEAFTVCDASSPSQVRNIMKNAKLAICTRMHSAIIAITTQTPVIAIEYEHKMKGFLALLHLEKWNKHISQVDYQFLKRKFMQLNNYSNYRKYTQTIAKQMNKLTIYRTKIEKEIDFVVN